MGKENRNILLAIIAIAVVTYFVCQWMKKREISQSSSESIKK
jgi:hypothetical protein